MQRAGNNVAEESVALTKTIADQSIRGKENLFVDSAENRCKSNVENLIQHNLVTITNEPTTSNINGHALSVAASSPLISKEGLNSHNLVPIVEGTALDKVMTLVAYQSVSILKTPWGDLVDEEPDMSDDEQEQNLEGELEEASIFTPFISRRKKKYNRKHANKLSDKGVQNTSSEHIQTRSKKGVITSNPKYM